MRFQVQVYHGGEPGPRCIVSGLELQQQRVSVLVAIASRRHVRSCSPRVLQHMLTLLTSCALCRSRGALTNEVRRVICRADFP